MKASLFAKGATRQAGTCSIISACRFGGHDDPFVWMVSTSLKQPADVFVFRRADSVADTMGELCGSAGDDPVPSILWQQRIYRPSGYRGHCAFLFHGGVFLRTNSFWGEAWCFSLSTMMIPNEVIAIPMFLFMRELGWINTHLPLIILPIFGAGGVFGVFVMRQFFWGFRRSWRRRR